MKRRSFVQAAGFAGLGALARPDWRVSVPTGAPLLDAHAHLMSPALADVAEQAYGRRGLEPLDAAEVVRRMDAAGIRRAAVHSAAYMMAVDAVQRDVPLDKERREVESENDFAARECARFPDRLIPFLSLNPKRDYAIAELDRAVDRSGMRGLKLHFWNSLVDTRQPEQLARVKTVIGHAAERSLPVLAHAFVGDVEGYGPDDTERLVREVIEPLPSLRICFAHAAGAGGFAGAAQRCLERLGQLTGAGSSMADRVWIDIAAVLRPGMPEQSRTRFAELVRAFGVGRTLWGSDTFESYLATTREIWPLEDDEWRAVCRNDGAAWLG
ncbi:MAG: amidohydrolase family protein [Gemmatimonadales bacterium]